MNMWSRDRKAFVCSCHGSIYDPKNDAEVLFGPAPRPLAGVAAEIRKRPADRRRRVHRPRRR